MGQSGKCYPMIVIEEQNMCGRLDYNVPRDDNARITLDWER